MSRETLPVSSSRAADMLGVSAAQFRRIAAELGVEPDGYVDNPHAPGGPSVPVWAVGDVERMRGSAEVATARARRRAAVTIAESRRPA